jgi:hypothetical protein
MRRLLGSEWIGSGLRGLTSQLAQRDRTQADAALLQEPATRQRPWWNVSVKVVAATHDYFKSYTHGLTTKARRTQRRRGLSLISIDCTLRAALL